jgi:hypothetical protein
MSIPLEKGQSGIEIMLIDTAGNLEPATIDLFFRDWTDSDGCRHTDCQTQLSWASGVAEGMDWNWFASFKKVRKQLEVYGLLPVCHGASRRVILTGMAADMGGGSRIWRVNDADEMYRPTVDIFKTGEDVEPVSVEEQEAFQAAWWKREKERLSQQNNCKAADSQS